MTLLMHAVILQCFLSLNTRLLLLLLLVLQLLLVVVLVVLLLLGIRAVAVRVS